MKNEINKIAVENINVFYQENNNDISRDITNMLKNIYSDESDLEILIINKIPYSKSIYMEKKINKILNGDEENLRNFSVNIFYYCNKISIKNLDESEFDIFSSKNNFSMIFLRKYSADFIISKIIHGDTIYPEIIKKSYFKNLSKG